MCLYFNHEQTGNVILLFMLLVNNYIFCILPCRFYEWVLSYQNQLSSFFVSIFVSINLAKLKAEIMYKIYTKS